MSKIKIQNLNGGNNILGDNNTVTNNFGITQSQEKVLTRDDYWNMILEIHEIERISLGSYLEDQFQKALFKNPDFVKILYKDIFKVIDDVNAQGDNDLLIQNGDFVVEYGDYKQTGHPTNLHFALTWLHLKLIEELNPQNPDDLEYKLRRFEDDFLKINYDTPVQQKRTSELNRQLRVERKSKDKSGWKWSDFNEYLELKPNIAGVGINLNAIFSKLFGRRR